MLLLFVLSSVLSGTVGEPVEEAYCRTLTPGQVRAGLHVAVEADGVLAESGGLPRSKATFTICDVAYTFRRVSGADLSPALCLYKISPWDYRFGALRFVDGDGVNAITFRCPAFTACHELVCRPLSPRPVPLATAAVPDISSPPPPPEPTTSTQPPPPLPTESSLTEAVELSPDEATEEEAEVQPPPGAKQVPQSVAPPTDGTTSTASSTSTPSSTTDAPAFPTMPLIPPRLPDSAVWKLLRNLLNDVITYIDKNSDRRRM